MKDLNGIPIDGVGANAPIILPKKMCSTNKAGNDPIIPVRYRKFSMSKWRFSSIKNELLYLRNTAPFTHFFILSFTH